MVSRETFLDAVFLWITPWDLALSIAGMASAKAVLALSISLASTANLTFLIRVFKVERIWTFLKLLFSLCFCLLRADLWVAKSSPPLGGWDLLQLPSVRARVRSFLNLSFYSMDVKLEFPDFVGDSVVSEHNLLEKWGTDQG